jgi:hypothetical protein
MRHASSSPRKSQLTQLHFSFYIKTDHCQPTAIFIKYILFPLCCSNRIKNANKTYFMLHFFKNKTYLIHKRLTKEHNNRQNVNTCIRNLETNRDRKRMNSSKGKMYKRNLGQV